VGVKAEIFQKTQLYKQVENYHKIRQPKLKLQSHLSITCYANQKIIKNFKMVTEIPISIHVDPKIESEISNQNVSKNSPTFLRLEIETKRLSFTNIFGRQLSVKSEVN